MYSLCVSGVSEMERKLEARHVACFSTAQGNKLFLWLALVTEEHVAWSVHVDLLYGMRNARRNASRGAKCVGAAVRRWNDEDIDSVASEKVTFLRLSIEIKSTSFLAALVARAVVVKTDMHMHRCIWSYAGLLVVGGVSRSWPALSAGTWCCASQSALVKELCEGSAEPLPGCFARSPP